MASLVNVVKKLGKKMTGKDIKGNDLVKVVDTIANNYAGGGGDDEGGGDNNEQVIVTCYYDSQTQKYIVSKTFDEIIGYILAGNHNIALVFYDYGLPTEAENSGSIYHLGAWAYNTYVPKDYLAVTFERSFFTPATPTLMSIQYRINGDDTVERNMIYSQPQQQS